MQRKTYGPCSLVLCLLFASPNLFAEELEAFTEPAKRVAIPAPEIGVISEILVKEGDEVRETQILARLDDSVLRASLEVAKAAKDALGSRRSAEAELTMREKQLESYKELRERGNATQRELERAESEYHQAASRLQTVREELEVRRLEYERVKAQIKQRVLRTPIHGFVVAIDKEVGEFVSPTDAVIMHVVHLDTLKAVFMVPIDAAQGLSVGQNVKLNFGYHGKIVGGVIEFVSPVAQAESSTVRVKVRIPNQKHEVQSGVVCRWDLRFEPAVEKTTRASEAAGSIR